MRNPLPIPGTDDGAMTEVALALAMGFFSILVLTLVSIGGSGKEFADYQAIHLVDTAPTMDSAVASSSDDIIIIFDGERLYDVDLQPLDPAALAPDVTRRVVLAVDSNVALADIMSVRSRIATKNLVIANLNESWRAAVEAVREADND